MNFFKINEPCDRKDILVVADQAGIGQHPIDADSFIGLNPKKLGTAYFVDGGLQEIFSSANQGFYLLRLSYVKFVDNKRIEQKIFNAFIKTSGVAPFEYQFSEPFQFFDDIPGGFFDCPKEFEAETFVNQIRRIAELRLSIDLASNMKEGELLVLDGSIYPSGYDANEIKALITLCQERQINLIGFSKNSLLKSQSGSLIREDILEFSRSLDLKRWVCYNVFFEDTLKISTSYAYLHPLSKFAFRIDHITNPIIPLERLSTNSSDGTFPGYPYGLIIVDKLARVKNEEKNYLYSKHFLSRNLIEEQNPHEILDNM